MKVLIADDDGVSRALLRAHLEKAGHEVVEATNGRSAWQTFRNGSFPLVISDWMMPEVDGLELCRMMRAEDRRLYTYVILLTALGGRGSYLEGMRAGADDFLSKPFDAEMFRSRLHVAERILKLQSEVSQLQALLPICSYCKKIRGESGSWVPVEAYIAARTDTRFSHGICSDCYRDEVLPELARHRG